MEEMTLEQRRAMALAAARARAAQGTAPAPQAVPEGSQAPQRAATAGGGPLALFNRALWGGGAAQAGAADAVIKGVVGLKDLVGLASDNDRAVLEQIKQESEADPEKMKRTAGGVVANVAGTFVPGNAVAKAVQGVKLLPSALRGIAGAAGAAGATDFALTPGSYSDKADAAIESAKTAGLLQGGGQLLGKSLTGMFKATPDAEKMFAQGINPTLQQAAAGPVGRFVGGLTAGVQNLKTRWNDEVANAILKKATEGNESLPSGTGEEFVNAAQRYIGDEYGKIWNGKRVQLSPRHREAVVSRVGVLPADGVGKDEATEAARIMANRMGVTDGVSDAATNFPLNPQTFRERFRKPITDAAMAADGEVRARLLEGRALLDKLVTTKNLTKAEQARLKEINALNFDAMRMEEAARGGGMAKEGLDLSRLNRAYERMLDQGRSMGNTTYDEIISPAMRISSVTPNQNTARSMKATATRLAPAALGVLGTTGAAATLGLSGAVAVGIPYGLSALGQTAAGAKALTGQYDSQRILAELLRNNLAGLTGAGGAALTNQE